MIWLFCNKAANNTINRVRKLALRVLYQDFESFFGQFLSKHDDISIHVKYLKKLRLEALLKSVIPLGNIANKIYNLELTQKRFMRTSTEVSYDETWDYVPEI